MEQVFTKKFEVCEVFRRNIEMNEEFNLKRPLTEHRLIQQNMFVFISASF